MAKAQEIRNLNSSRQAWLILFLYHDYYRHTTHLYSEGFDTGNRDEGHKTRYKNGIQRFLFQPSILAIRLPMLRLEKAFLNMFFNDRLASNPCKRRFLKGIQHIEDFGKPYVLCHRGNRIWFIFGIKPIENNNKPLLNDKFKSAKKYKLPIVIHLFVMPLMKFLKWLERLK